LTATVIYFSVIPIIDHPSGRFRLRPVLQAVLLPAGRIMRDCCLGSAAAALGMSE
jgi:hypothetical protein